MIKFKHTDLSTLRNRLLSDLKRENAAILFGKTHKIDGYSLINIYDIRYAAKSDFDAQSQSFLRFKKEFIYRILKEITSRHDVDTIVDVHTHPFSKGKVSFSPVDDNDEICFFNFIKDKFEGINYASIVLSRNEYSARIWEFDNKLKEVPVQIKTQTKAERIPSSNDNLMVNKCESNLLKTSHVFNRSALALGLNVMRNIMDGEVITLVGVGGLGSIIGEHLVHMGFQKINLIDNDMLEMSNLNRFVGAYYEDAKTQAKKVEVLAKHLSNINPSINISCYNNDICDESIEKVVAASDWIIVSTDTHSSRFRAQQLSIKYFVPLISVGVNITVDNGKILDVSGEVITSRVGDCLCLNCLGRINSIKMANEKHPDESIRKALVSRGYVSGADIKEPAVKTLNSHLATMAVDVLVNQYTQANRHSPILVFENNYTMNIYEDVESLRNRNKYCYTCNI